jgi:hypothetical protein
VRIIALIEYAAILVGIIAMIAGRFFALHKGFELGLGMVGAGVALGGLEGVVTQRMGLRSSEDAYEAYGGTPALIFGLLLLLGGAATIAAAYLLADGLWSSTVAYLTRRPAGLLAAAALLLVGIGVLMMLNPKGPGSFLWTLLVYLPRALIGLIVVLAGIAAIALAAWEFLDPRAFDDFVGKLPSARELMRGLLSAVHAAQVVG